MLRGVSSCPWAHKYRVPSQTHSLISYHSHMAPEKPPKISPEEKLKKLGPGKVSSSPKWGQTRNEVKISPGEKVGGCGRVEVELKSKSKFLREKKWESALSHPLPSSPTEYAEGAPEGPPDGLFWGPCRSPLPRPPWRSPHAVPQGPASPCCGRRVRDAAEVSVRSAPRPRDRACFDDHHRPPPL